MTFLTQITGRFSHHAYKPLGCLTLLLVILLAPTVAMAKKKADPFKNLDFLPPVASINPKRTSLDNTEADTTIQSLEGTEPESNTIELNGVPKPVLRTKAPAQKIDNDLGIVSGSEEVQNLQKMTQTLDQEELKKLWDATVERNPVIRFTLEKLVTPEDLKQKHASIYLNKTLNVLISGATMASAMLPGASAYRNMGVMAGGDAIRNVVSGKTQLQGTTLTPTEQIQLAGLVDELQQRMIRNYQEYKSTLASLIQARAETLRTNTMYSKAMSQAITTTAIPSQIAVLASSAAYYQALDHETALRQRAKLVRLELERLAGADAVKQMKLTVLDTQLVQTPKTPDDNTVTDNKAVEEPSQAAGSNRSAIDSLPNLDVQASGGTQENADPMSNNSNNTSTAVQEIEQATTTTNNNTATAYSSKAPVPSQSILQKALYPAHTKLIRDPDLVRFQKPIQRSFLNPAFLKPSQPGVPNAPYLEPLKHDEILE